MNEKIACNPYLPSYEYVPDGEPYVFGDRVYVYGSHDRFNGYGYCQNDYVCWSAPVVNLGDWRYEGVIYPRNEDPLNQDGDMYLFAPDVTKGPDGRYYLYYVLDHVGVVSVAVCDTPAGQYRFYGYVHYEDGIRLGEAADDEPQFDPGVLTEGKETFLYTGFCMPNNKNRHGAMVTELKEDMLTIKRKPQFVVPSKPYEEGTGFEGHAFFEASSIRKVHDKYYFIYSSILNHELCYAISDSPFGPFSYQGAIVSNNDMFIDTYKPADRAMYYGGNNHGSIEQINGEWYIFYHRHTNGTNYSRQGCIEKIEILPNGMIPQVEMTSQGASGTPFVGKGSYPAYIACNLFCKDYSSTVGGPGDFMDNRFPRITQDQPDGTPGQGYISNMKDGSTAGFKYFDCHKVTHISVTTRGAEGTMLIRTKWDGEIVGSICLGNNNEWKSYEAVVSMEDGVWPLYFEYKGRGHLSFSEFTLS